MIDKLLHVSNYKIQALLILYFTSTNSFDCIPYVNLSKLI
jgi:hypothetical protein